MLTLQVLLALAEGQSSDILDAPLEKTASRLIGSLPGGTTVRVAHNLRHHRTAAIEAGEPLDVFDGLVVTGLVPNHTKVPITSFDSVLEVTASDDSDPDGLLDAVHGLAEQLGTAIDPSRSAAVLGIDYPISAGSGATQLFVCLYRVNGASHEEFCDWWLHTLVEHTTKTPGKSAYRQLHADPELTRRAAGAAGVAIDDIDGVALEFYPDLTRFYSAVAWADQPHAAIVEAETQMIDFSRAKAIMAYQSS